MANLNKCIFIGTLGKDPKISYMPSGSCVSNFSIAINEKWKDKDGNKQESTEWVNITAFNRLAEICGEYLKKGSQVYIEGKIKTDKYDKNGVDTYATKIVAREMQMLGNRSGDAPQQQQSQQSQQSAQAPQQEAPQNFDNFDSDIPF